MPSTEMQALEITLPHGWLRIDLHADRAQELERVAQHLTRSAPRDSARVYRDKVQARLGKMIEEYETDDSHSIHSILFPGEPVSGFVLPVTIAIGSIPPPEVDLSPTEVLVVMAQGNPSSHPVAIGDIVALRTHQINSVGESVVETASEFFEGDKPETPFEAYSLRTHYVFGWNEPDPVWFAVVCSALMPADEATSQLIDSYHGLFDLIVSTITRPKAEAT